MLRLVTKPDEFYNEITNEFSYGESITMEFELTLRSIFEWEGIYKTAYSEKKNFTLEELKDLMNICCVSKNFDSSKIDMSMIDEFMKYSNDTASATTIQNGNKKSRGPKQIVTSEMIYAQVAQMGLSVQWAESINFNRLLIILNINSIQNSPPDKMSMNEIYKMQNELNRKRRGGV